MSGSSRLRAVFMGSPDFAVPSLEAVARTCELVLAVTQPDKPAGRGRKLMPPAVKEAALRLGVPVSQPVKVRDGTLAAQLQALTPDVIVVTAYGRILPRAILEVPRHGCINVHASLLPRWRGAAPIQRAVLAGDRETGVAIMQMEEGLDTGPVFRAARTPIDPEETSGELFLRLATLGGDLLAAFLGEFPDVPPPTPQDPSLATLAPILRKEEGWSIGHGLRDMSSTTCAGWTRGRPRSRGARGRRSSCTGPGRHRCPGPRARTPARSWRSTAPGCTWRAAKGWCGSPRSRPPAPSACQRRPTPPASLLKGEGFSTPPRSETE
ncbi:methionyl-tRNA formyltransferase [Nannocystis pusilla]|uniref:Methionyl-tRNA formyltransferase n=1 Tax=Nannocystis pusilla TaxID=889268 RepID=A0A9X3J2I1_9BACT|nr:methionyl-tRNA formyltransferase [Nannocystis pusilla]